LRRRGSNEGGSSNGKSDDQKDDGHPTLTRRPKTDPEQN
jgi:hypothetical protein